MSEGRKASGRHPLSRTIEFRTKLVRSLATFDDDGPTFRALLTAFARAVFADIAVSRRIDANGSAVLDGFRATKIDPLNGRVSRLAAILSKPMRAGRSLSRSTDGKTIVAVLNLEGPGSFAMTLVRDSAPFDHTETEAVARGLEIIEPLLVIRAEYNRRETIRLKAERELRASEEEFRRFFEDSRDMVYTVNAEDRIASINPAGLALLSATSRFDAIGRVFSDFVLNPDDRKNFLHRIRQNGFVKDYEIIVKPHRGEPKFCIETAHAVLRPDGSLSAIQGILKDISDYIAQSKALWKANLELAETNSRLQEAQVVLVQREKLASIGQLAAGVAHEINNPLGFLKSNHESLKKFASSFDRAWRTAARFLPPEIRAEIEETEDLDFAAEELPHMFTESDDGFLRIMEIVSQLKAFSRVDSEGQRTLYDLEHGIESTLVVAWNEIKYVAEVKRVFGGVQQVEAEGGPINQVLLNILVNAAQAIAGQGRKEKGLITIETREEKDFIVCLINDDGPGMSEEVQRHIFEPFFTTKEPGKGTGLGLSISYDIVVNRHHGRLDVHSEPGKGSTFIIALPIQGELGDDGIKG
jgi:two-component system, NtrC family, sensor kinase